MSSLFTAAFSRAPSVGKVLFSVTVGTNKEWIVWREGVFCHGRALRLIVSVFQWDLRPVIFLSRIIALCGKWGFFWLSAPTHTTLCEQALILLFFFATALQVVQNTQRTFIFPSVTWEQHRRDAVLLSGAGGGTFQFSLHVLFVQQTAKNRQNT